jgi:hypothetical protein
MANNTGTFFNVNDNDGIPLVGVSTDGKVMINHLYGNCLIGSTSVTGTALQPLQVTGGAYISGNLGVGTTNPTAKLDVDGSGKFSGTVSGSNITIEGNVTGSSTSCTGNAGSVTNGFYTTSSFNLGTTSIAANRASGVQTLTGINIDGSAGSANALNTGNNYQVNSIGVGTAASGTAGEIRATNNVTAYYSDERLKENIKPISSALSKLLTLRGVTFNSNKIAEQYGYTDKKEQVGVIAQDVEKVLPQVVVAAPFDIAQDENGNEYSNSGENYKTVHYDKLIPLLIESIKEQSGIINNMKKEIEDLKSKIST